MLQEQVSVHKCVKLGEHLQCFNLQCCFVQGAVSVMNSKLSLLDQPNVDAVEARLQSVMHKLSQIADKKAAQDNPERQQKVSCFALTCPFLV